MEWLAFLCLQAFWSPLFYVAHCGLLDLRGPPPLKLHARSTRLLRDVDTLLGFLEIAGLSQLRNPGPFGRERV